MLQAATTCTSSTEKTIYSSYFFSLLTQCVEFSVPLQREHPPSRIIYNDTFQHFIIP